MSRVYFLISSVIGAELALVFFELSRKFYSDLTYNQSLIICLIIIVLTIAFCLFIQQIKYKVLCKHYNKKSEKSIADLEKKISKSSDKVLRSKLYIRLSEIYMEANDFQSALKAIKRANPYSSFRSFNTFYILPQKYKLEFYIKIVYLNILMNNLLSATDVLSYAKKYFNKYISNSKYSSEINKILAMLEYSKGDYQKAEDYINSALSESKNKPKDYELYFILGKVFLKTNRYSLFKSAMEKVIQNTQSEQLLNAAQKQLSENSH